MLIDNIDLESLHAVDFSRNSRLTEPAACKRTHLRATLTEIALDGLAAVRYVANAWNSCLQMKK
jgi:hypothetical protein